MMFAADYHVHSNCSPDGTLTMTEMAQRGIELGLQEICFTDHVDTIHWGTLTPRDDFDWHKLQTQFAAAQAACGDRIRLKLGAELGEAYMGFDRAAHLLDTAPALDFIIGSVHMAGVAGSYVDLYYIEKGDRAYYNRLIDQYLDDMLRLVDWGRFSVLGHMTLPLRYINENFHEGMDFSGHMDRVEEIFRRLIPKGLGIECNTNRGNAPLPDRDILTLYHNMGGEIITLGSDAHTAAHLGLAVRERQELLRQCGFRYFTVFDRMKPNFLAL